jgi:hypothetical protein
MYIGMGFRYTFYLDGLPSATILRDAKNKEMDTDYFLGIPIGQKDSTTGAIVLYNHFDIIVRVHSTIEGHKRIVGFDVEPYSMKQSASRSLNDPALETDQLILKAGELFSFSYRMITKVSILYYLTFLIG